MKVTSHPVAVPMESLPSLRGTEYRDHRHEWTHRAPESVYQRACRAVDEAEAKRIKEHCAASD